MRKPMAATLTLAAALMTLSSCGASSTENTSSATPPKAENVKVQPLTLKSINRVVEYATSLIAYEEVHMAPASPGRIEQITVEVGDRVAQGQLLAIMDQTQLHQAQVQLRNAETDYQRFDTLNKVGGVARQQYDQVKANYDITRSNVAFLTENTRLKAPFSGVVSGKYYENGEMYSGSPTAAGKAAIVSLVQMNRLKTLANVSEQFFPQIKKGMPVSLVCDIYPGRTFTGTVSRIYPTIDAATRTFPVEVELPNADEALRPGMFARVSFELDKVEALLVPAQAILKMQGSDERYLFVADNGKARRVSLKMGQRINDEVEIITNNIQAGDQIIVAGQARLLDGMPVNVMP